ncbi:MAG: hypothetical protein SA339_08355 [Methanomassiliicoccus sp.]|nr:hypothetical protein [Methanomassiliicoccus sp.]
MKKAPSEALSIMIMDNNQEVPRIELKIQKKSQTYEPKKCFGHHATGSRYCLACGHDRICAQALIMTFSIEIKRASINIRDIKKMEG